MTPSRPAARIAIQLVAPVRRPLDQPGQRATAEWIADRNPDLMPLFDQSKIEGAEIAIVTDTQESHQAVNLPKIRTLRGLVLKQGQAEFLPIALETARAMPQPKNCALADRARPTGILGDERARNTSRFQVSECLTSSTACKAK